MYFQTKFQAICFNCIAQTVKLIISANIGNVITDFKFKANRLLFYDDNVNEASKIKKKKMNEKAQKLQPTSIFVLFTRCISKHCTQEVISTFGNCF